MRMRIKRANMKRLASLSALGAGALGVAAGTAEAGIVNVPLPANTKVGFNLGYFTSFSVTVLSSAHFGLSRNETATGPSSLRIQKFFNSLSGAQLLFKPGDATGGQTWSQLASSVVGSMRLGLRQNTHHRWMQPGPGQGYTRNGIPYFNPTSQFMSSVNQSHTGTDGYFYKLFQFNVGSGDLFGWAYFHQSLSDYVGPDVDILGIAYDDQGNQIGAGETGTAVPEPSTMALTGLAALALGATGLRRWRAVRKA